MTVTDAEDTAWARWVRTQPTGVLTDACRKTGLSWTTIMRAKRKRVNSATAKILSKYTRGAVSFDDLVRQIRPS